jgi:hypothetical protein
MKPLHKRLVLVSASGFSLSGLLTALEALHHNVIWMILQLPGFLVGSSTWRGIDSGGNSFSAVMLAVNGLVYSSLLLVALGLHRRADR